MTKDEIEALKREYCGFVSESCQRTVTWLISDLAQRGVNFGKVAVPDDMFKKLGSVIPTADGGTFENDPSDAIIDAAIRCICSNPVLHPTTKMMEAGKRALDDCVAQGDDVHDHAYAAIVYKAMIAHLPVGVSIYGIQE